MEQQNNTKVWVVRGGRNGEYESMSLDQELSVLGWEQVPDLTDKTEEEIKETVKQLDPQSRAYSQLTALVFRIKQDDIIVLPLKTQPGKVAVGRVKGSYQYTEVEGGGTKNDTREK